jgi:O-antigen/teichoic acid export membrane protein
MVAYYARTLSVEGFGKVSFAQSILVYFTMITLFGFQTLGTKEVSKDSKGHESLVGYVTSIRFAVALISFIVIIIIAITIDKGLVFKNILIIYGITLFPIAFNIDWFFSGTQEMQYNGIYNILKGLIPFILLIIFLKNESHIYLIPIFTLVGLVVAVFYQFYIYRIKKKLRFKFNMDKNKYKSYIIASTPFLISGLLSMINCNIDSIIIGLTRSEYELGIYSSAYKIIFFLINIIAVIFTPFFPLLISLYHDKSHESLKSLVNNISKIIMMLALPITVGGIILSKDIIVLLFGEKYMEAYGPFIILLIYIFILFMRETYGYSLNAWNMEKKYLKIVSISAAVNLILNILLIPTWGVLAAALTTVISEIINFAMMRKYCFKVARTDYISNIFRLLIPILIMTGQIILFKYLNINVLINISIAIILYFLSIVYFKYITVEDVKRLLRR